MNIINTLSDLNKKGKAVVLCTITASEGSTPRNVGSKMLVFPDGAILGSVGGGEMEAKVIRTALKALESETPHMLEYAMVDPARGDPGVCGGTVNIFVEPILPRPTVVVVGAGHVGRAVAHLAHWLDLRVVVSDDREELCTPELIPGGDEYIPAPLSKLPERFEITPYSYILLTTRNVMVDVEGLPALLETPAAYIGVIGSRRRWATTRKKLEALGISQEKLARVVSPIGLEINAETPEEIAVSMLGEIIMLIRGGDGSRMGVEG